MGKPKELFHTPPTPSWITGLAYIGALMAGVVLITTHSATPAEASGYVAPFLVIYERVLVQRATQ